MFWVRPLPPLTTVNPGSGLPNLFPMTPVAQPAGFYQRLWSQPNFQLNPAFNVVFPCAFSQQEQYTEGNLFRWQRTDTPSDKDFALFIERAKSDFPVRIGQVGHLRRGNGWSMRMPVVQELVQTFDPFFLQPQTYRSPARTVGGRPQRRYHVRTYQQKTVIVSYPYLGIRQYQREWKTTVSAREWSEMLGHLFDIVAMVTAGSPTQTGTEQPSASPPTMLLPPPSGVVPLTHQLRAPRGQ